MATSATSATENAPFRGAVFTQYGDPPDWDIVNNKLRFMAYGLEHCPTTGREHYQGFAYAKTSMRWSAWKKVFPTGHFEKMMGSFASNETYCSKESNLIKFGEMPAQGERKDLMGLKRKLDEIPIENTDYRVMDVSTEDAYFNVVAKHSRFAKEYLRHRRDKAVNANRDMPRVWILYGFAGAGKTRWLDRKFGLNGYKRAPDNTGQWFDGCDRDVILFDDVEVNQVPPFSLWKRLCDRYPFSVPVKGGFITWKPKDIVFTSNYTINEWWKELDQENQAARDRRIYKTIYLDGTDAVQTHEVEQQSEDIQEETPSVSEEELYEA